MKNALNFGNDIFYTILNYTFVEENGKETIMDPVIKTKHNATKNFKHMNLKCAGCLLGKMKRRSDKTTLTKNIGEMILKEGIFAPGTISTF